MIDLHFDLLTKLYMCYLNQDFTYIEEYVKNINKDNVTGLIANLCFMSKEEMQLEYHPNYYNEDVSVIDMFSIVKQLLEKYLPNSEIIMSIEGCDYVEIKDLDKLYELGLRAILPVWNEENKYGSGNRSNKGLTNEGKKLILHAIELGIGIDLSHANINTFNDIIEVAKLAKEEGLEPIIYASHSNVYNLCKRDRNLTDEQLLKIKELDGIVGVFSHRNFIYKDSLKNNIDNEIVIKKYIEHINYLKQLFGDIRNIAVSTDDMSFCGEYDSDYYKCPIFNYSTIKQDLWKYLKKCYNDDEIFLILEGNANRLFNRLKKVSKIKEFRR